MRRDIVHVFAVHRETQVTVFAHHRRSFPQLFGRASPVKTQYTVSKNRNIVHGISDNQPCCRAIFSPHGTGNQAVPNVQLMKAFTFLLWHAFGSYTWHCQLCHDISVLVSIPSLKHFIEGTTVIARKAGCRKARG